MFLHYLERENRKLEMDSSVSGNTISDDVCKCHGNTVATKYSRIWGTWYPTASPHQPCQPWWYWTGIQMAYYDGKHSTCPILEKFLEGRDDL